MRNNPCGGHRMKQLAILMAILSLVIIVFTAIKVNSLAKKTAIYLATGGIAAGVLWFFGGENGHHAVQSVFFEEYPQFIPIPLVTVLIASLALFRVNTPDDAKLGWFLLAAPPVLGNFATTWAVAPIALSVTYVIKMQHPKRWLDIMIIVCAFSMNFLAVFTLLADPPQAFWAIKAKLAGNPLGFFFPTEMFWVYGVYSWILYAICLKRLGVQFGSLRNILIVKPKSWAKFAFGGAISGSIVYALVWLEGYEITTTLGITFVAICFLALVVFRRHFHESHESHNTFHWSVDTAAIFVAFFGIVAWIHFANSDPENMSKPLATLAVVGQTLLVDNVAAFSSMYPVFDGMPRVYMSWFNLAPSIIFGGTSPLGNGPQIVLFLIIYVGMGWTDTREIFIRWIKEACVFVPYLATWVLSMMILIRQGITVTIPMQLLIGIVSIVVANQMMDLQTNYRMSADTGWSGKEDEDQTVVSTGWSNKVPIPRPGSNGDSRQDRPNRPKSQVFLTRPGKSPDDH
jgi:hypothetical protein